MGRGANASEIGDACDRYGASVKEVVQQIEEGYLDKVVLQQRFKLTLDQLEDLRVTLTNDELRDIYEKVGQQTTAADYQERKGHVPQAVRYMQALGSSMQLAGFFMLVFVFIEKHVSDNFQQNITNTCYFANILKVITSCNIASIREAGVHDIPPPCHIYLCIHAFPQGR